MLSLSMLRQNLVKIHSFIFKILSGNKILMLFKCRNSIMDRRKLTLNNPKFDVVSVYAHAKFGQKLKIHSFVVKILSGNKIRTSFKGHNSIMN